jgi:hypothetical protein
MHGQRFLFMQGDRKFGVQDQVTGVEYVTSAVGTVTEVTDSLKQEMQLKVSSLYHFIFHTWVFDRRMLLGRMKECLQFLKFPYMGMHMHTNKQTKILTCILFKLANWPRASPYSHVSRRSCA